MTLTIMTFNIRGSFHDMDGDNIWEKRRHLNIDTIKKYNPDVIGIQEAQTGTLADYETHLTDYTIEQGLVSIRTTERRHYVPIYYRTERFEKVDSGGFYLSETPDVFSQGWDAVYPRAVTWIILRDLWVNQNFLLMNTHYNHEQDNHHSRIQSSKLIVEKSLEHGANLPKFVTADFNARPDSETHQVYMDSGYVDLYSAIGHDEAHTMHSYQGEAFPYKDARIDWILLNDADNKLRVTACDIITDYEGTVYPSDHYPVVAQLEWIR